jgi:hypothetical protein
VRATRLLLVLAVVLAAYRPTAVRAQNVDRFGDPLPVGALTRLGTVRFHRAGCAAFSPDGKRIATADRNEVCVCDAASGQVIRRLTAR